jgi:N-acetyl-anhydromuramyl-L-alanine amidase AmpD
VRDPGWENGAVRGFQIVVFVSLVSSAAQAQAPRGRDAAVLVRTPGVAPRAWTAIVVHHSASSAGNAASFEAYHRGVRHFARGMAYHFVIGNGRGLGDGEIEVGSRWTRQEPGAHVAAALRDGNVPWDNVAIGICLVGNFETSSPTRKQLETLSRLVSLLRRRFHIPAERVLGHGAVPGAHTACPGRSLDLARLLDR